MVTSSSVSVKNGDVLLLVGTTKGVFLSRSSGTRKKWDLGGPYFPGLSVYALAYDGRAGRQRIWAAPQSAHWGADLCSSDDFGKSWNRPETPRIRFPEAAGASLVHIWQIAPGPERRSETLYCGVQPAALFESRDSGQTWSLMTGLWEHPHRSRWMPGGGGLCLHTILTDPGSSARLTVAISAGGVYRSDDGGKAWQARNHGVRADFLPDKHPEFGQCVHKIVRHPSKPERLYLQNHFGLYRSDDGGDSWRDIGHGVPSDFGFCMEVHPEDPDTVFIVPLESDEFRCTPGGRLRVYRTRNAGRSWEPLTRGLPQKGVFETVLRDALASDALDPTGVYFGTRSGKLYGSRDSGRSWELLRDGLPAITCVKAALVENLSRRGRAKSTVKGRSRRSPLRP